MRTVLFRLATTLLFLPGFAFATTRTVTNLNDSGTGSLRDTIAQSVNGDSINFSVTGTIPLTSGELGIGRNITILGPGATSLTVTRSTSAATNFRIFHISNGTPTGPTVSISGLTISGGVMPTNSGTLGGAGVLSDHSVLTLSDCVIENNSHTAGGSSPMGAGVLNYAFNSANGSLTMINCTVRGNAINGAGGGVASYGLNNPNASLTMTNCTVNGNSSNGAAGGIEVSGGNCALTNCTITGNGAGGGAGFSCDSAGTRTIVNSTITGNTTNGAGGGIYNGGGLSILNTIVAGNNAFQNQGPDVYSGTAINSQGHNFIGKTDGSSGWVASDYTGTSVSPLDPQLGPLQDNGGLTQTMALSGSSAAVDAGSDVVLVEPINLMSDQRGPGFPRKIGAHVDIGAFEFDNVPQAGPNFVVTNNFSHDDGVCGNVDCTLPEAINLANSIAGDNVITFAPGVTGMITLTSALPNVTSNLVLQGPGARLLAVSGNGAYRVFSFVSGASTISGLTITGGFVSTPLQSSVFGGGIFNQNTLTLTDCALSGNQAQGGSASFAGSGGSGEGGAIYNSGMLSLNHCTVSGNSARGGLGANAGLHGAGGGGAATGGIFNDSSGTLTLNNCTIANNTAVGGNGANGGSSHVGGTGGYGYGGILNVGAMTVTASTITGNHGSAGAGGSGNPSGASGIPYGGLSNAGTSIVGDTILAGNAVSPSGGNVDVSGAFNSAAYNLIGQSLGGSGFTNGVNHDQVDVNANLGSFGNNGGSTDTVALLSNSPAINAGNPNAPSQDQRYYLRNGVPDIGALESGGTLAPISTVSRKTHAASTFDIILPISGASGDECRSGGATGDYQIVLTFATPVSVTGNPQAQITSGTGQIGTGGISNGGVVSVSGAIVTVPLTNVANAQKITLTLSNVSDGSNTNNVNVVIGFLLGDTSGNGTVNASDVSQTKARSGQTVDASNFRNDVTVNGSVNASDVSLVKSRSGTALP